MNAPTLAEALARAQREGVARLDARLLLAHQLGRSRSWVLTHDEHPLDESQWSAFAAALRRRVAGEPLAYIVGEKEFHGLVLRVDSRVLVPRPDTETLVDWALELLGPGGALAGVAQPEVVDLGTGSGAIALAVKRACPHARVTAVDISPDALAVARANGTALGMDVEWLQGAWWAPLAGRRFHLALGNPPYVADADPHLAALSHEPRLALASGPTGLDSLQAIIGRAAAHLLPQGWLLLEHGFEQAEPVRDALSAAGLRAPAMRRDLAGQPRCSGGSL